MSAVLRDRREHGKKKQTTCQNGKKKGGGGGGGTKRRAHRQCTVGRQNPPAFPPDFKWNEIWCFGSAVMDSQKTCGKKSSYLWEAPEKTNYGTALFLLISKRLQSGEHIQERNASLSLVGTHAHTHTHTHTHNTTQHNTTQHNTTQHNTTQHNTAIPLTLTTENSHNTYWRWVGPWVRVRSHTRRYDSHVSVWTAADQMQHSHSQKHLAPGKKVE